MQGVLGRGEGGWIEWLTSDLSSFAMLSFSLLYFYVLYYAYSCYICVQYPWPPLGHALVFTSLLFTCYIVLIRVILMFCAIHLTSLSLLSFYISTILTLEGVFVCNTHDLSSLAMLSFSLLFLCWCSMRYLTSVYFIFSNMFLYQTPLHLLCSRFLSATIWKC